MKILDRMINIVIRIIIVLIITAPVAEQLVAFAYAERGYNAVGGEWLVVLLIAGGLWKLTGYISKLQKDSFEVQKARVQESKQAQDAATGKPHFETKEL